MSRVARAVVIALVLTAALSAQTPAAKPKAAAPAVKHAPPSNAAMLPRDAAPATFRLDQDEKEVRITTKAYEARISRAGFRLGMYRGGRLVLESAQPGDAGENLDFVMNGHRERVTKLTGIEQSPGVVILAYDTSVQTVVARVKLEPQADTLHLQVWVLHSDGNLVPSFRFRLQPSGYWYGGGFQGWRDPQEFPLNRARIAKDAFFAQGNTQGTPCWYATSGVALWVRTPRDFSYSINGKAGSAGDGLLSVAMPQASSLEYDIVVAKNIRDVVQAVAKRIGYPRATPPLDYFRQPIYTTWVEHKVPVSQQKVLEFAKAIRANKLPAGVIEIDDKWEAHYGDMDFDAAKFPDPKAMVAALHKDGFRVTLWVHPFVNTDSRTFENHQTDGILARDLSGNAGLIQWWNGIAAVWDFSNPAAASTFRRRLEALQQAYGFDGFKFDGGDVNLVPRDMQTAGHIAPAEFADVYNREAAAHFVWNETRVGMYSQPLGVVQRLIDKHSVWGKENGLAAIVPEALTVSLRGFPYVMPDMVGGNQYDNDRIDEELLIRWAQASSAMPLLQFSVGPWHLGDRAVRLCREASELHDRLAPYIYKLAQAAARTGEPIMLPLWYHAPDDAETRQIFDEFMVGADVVVAPVVVKGATARDLYLPAGRWRDQNSGEVMDGGRWLRNYAAPLEKLPLFVRDGSAALR